MDKTVAKRILVVKNRGLGDSIMALGGLSYLRSLFPESSITYGVPSWIAPLYQNTTTDADKILGLDLKKANDWIETWKKISGTDLIYEMFQSGRTGTFFKIYSFFHNRPYFYHNHHYTKGSVYRQGDVRRSAIQRDLDGVWSFFARHTGHPLPDDLDYTPQIKLNSRPPKKENLIILGVVATRQTKMWPLKRYIELATKIIESFKQYKIAIPLASKDQNIEKELLEYGLPEGVFIVKKPLTKLPEFFSTAKLYIGNDTGLKHLAVALGVKTYTFFGPEPPAEWHPYDSSQHPYFFLEPLECRTVSSHYCGLSFCDHMSCLKEFRVTDVFDSISRDLESLLT